MKKFFSYSSRGTRLFVNTSLSKFIIAAVDGLLDEYEEFQPRREMVREMEALKVENKALRDDLRQKIIVMERYEGELKMWTC